jgi:hypothetical protein
MGIASHHPSLYELHPGYHSKAIFAGAATVFMLRAVLVLAAGMTSFDCPMPSP